MYFTDFFLADLGQRMMIKIFGKKLFCFNVCHEHEMNQQLLK
jgi:hypothetical protein